MAEKSVSLWTPILYLFVLVLALVVFSNQHRQRKLQKLASTKQFYENNFARDAFQQLKAKNNVPKKLMIAALLAWGVEDLTRVLKFKENEPILAALLEQGMIGEDFFERFTGSKTLNERELQEIAAESEKLGFPWGEAIQSITEITQQHALRRRLLQEDIFKQEYRELLGDNEPKDVESHLMKDSLKAMKQ